MLGQSSSQCLYHLNYPLQSAVSLIDKFNDSKILWFEIEVTTITPAFLSFYCAGKEVLAKVEGMLPSGDTAMTVEIETNTLSCCTVHALKQQTWKLCCHLI